MYIFLSILIIIAIFVGIGLAILKYLNGSPDVVSKPTPPLIIPSTTGPIQPSEPWPRISVPTRWDNIVKWFPSGTEFKFLGRRLCVEIVDYDAKKLDCSYVDNQGKLKMWYFHIESYDLLRKIVREQFNDKNVVEESTVEGTLKAMDTITKNFSPSLLMEKRP